MNTQVGKIRAIFGAANRRMDDDEDATIKNDAIDGITKLPSADDALSTRFARCPTTDPYKLPI